MNLHTETAIYAAVAELAKFVARATSDFRRDIKPTYGKILAEQPARLSVLVREANIRHGQDKLPYFEEILREVEFMQFNLRTLVDLGQEWLPRKTYEASVPLTQMVAKQAMAMRNHFAAPAQ